MASSAKKTKGKQKIEMKLIEKEDDKVVTFSKRRSGIYKKISEITTLCGADILFICFSPAGKPFSFGHPSIESVVDRFLNNNMLPSNDNTRHLVETRLKQRINNINQLYNEVIRRVDASKQKQEALAQQTSEREENLWWETPIHQLNPQDLEQHDSRYAELLNELYATRSRKLAAINSMPTPRDPAQLNPLTANTNEDVHGPQQ
ncbi:hypothetical protein HRI_000228300 [Hibiscus trionum]|uniref:MADS-box domain-containing protein n=1 Tax=Hibiscus trionum TaxID=183268 RepID=A0A9W7GX95_HIBTR|nr:hypothetical protein HRI_000228300 [Hibiscus trionum]